MMIIKYCALCLLQGEFAAGWCWLAEGGERVRGGVGGKKRSNK
jgi:hypothetical protein